ncbi:SAM-dependent methyltransferase [Spirillospora albida]|uniref:SAM-dependent methyltransferase n=1 Tax=Spirillospora albida TaxID=58123 RepID=UPI00068FF439|nr:SAM-dependent methyltransferase [Spirillospora albida]
MNFGTLAWEPVRTAPVIAPSVARIYDYFLGGKDNYASDRELAEKALRKAPVLTRMARENRAFLERAVTRLAEKGFRQFLDIGCGLPAAASVADVARRVHPECRVAYVDNDPLVLTHARALLDVDAGTGVFGADLREPAALLRAAGRLFEPGRPVAVLLFGVLDFVTDAEDPRGIVDALMGGLPPGSALVLTHTERTPDIARLAGRGAMDVPFTPRSRAEIAEICGGIDIVEPFPAPLPAAPSAPLPLIGCAGRGRG